LQSTVFVAGILVVQRASKVEHLMVRELGVHVNSVCCRYAYRPVSLETTFGGCISCFMISSTLFVAGELADQRRASKIGTSLEA
jgi:hypothetical protein